MSRHLQKFIQLESAGGIILVFVLILAIIIANSPLDTVYNNIVHMPIQIRIGALNIHKPILLWVNDGLMAIFFMLLAMEIKREILDGELSKPSQLSLPVVAAIGGIVVPAGVYLFFNAHNPDTVRGWPIPTTTDIAFTLGVVAILGKRVPQGLKVFLVALSIVDDILAVAIIAVFYTGSLSIVTLMLALAGVIALVIFNLMGVKRVAPYVLVGVLIWVCVLKSGVHATLAGVVVGLCIPYNGSSDRGHSTLRHLEETLHPWVAYFILPFFVFCNGGIALTGIKFSTLITPVPLGILLGLFVGKVVGVFLFSSVLIKAKLSKLPENSNWWQLVGICALTGIGFTMSLFLSSLAFLNTPYEELAKQGIIFGSLLSAALGIGILLLAYKKENIQKHDSNNTGNPASQTLG